MESLFQAAAAKQNQTSQQPTEDSQSQTMVSSSAPTGSMEAMFEKAAADAATSEQTAQQNKPVLSPEEQASQTRQMLVSGLTGLPTPNMSAEDRASFEKGKAAGAVSVPVVAGATTGASAVAEVLPSVLPHTIEGVKAIGSWAKANPIQAYILYQVIRDLIPGAKKAMGLIRGVPDVE
jgi:hypothetical protein